jgi:hypothetical protein
MKNKILIVLLFVFGHKLHSQIKITEFKPQNAVVTEVPVKKEANGCGMTLNYQNFTYTTVNIGSQCWMKENLRNTSFSDGSPITQGKEIEEWISGTEGKWCDYEDEKENKTAVEEYGKLYNWYAVNDSRGLAPYGWHIPSVAEFNSGGYINVDNYFGTKAGYRETNGKYYHVNKHGNWWTRSQESANNKTAWFFQNGWKQLLDYKILGMSVRCIKD